MAYQQKEYIHWTSDLTSSNPRGINRRRVQVYEVEYSEQPLESLTLSLRVKGSDLEMKTTITGVDTIPQMSEEELQRASHDAVYGLLHDFDVTSPRELIGKELTAIVYEDKDKKSIIGLKRED